MSNMLQIVVPETIESKAIVPIGYAKIPIHFLDGYDKSNPEYLILKNSSIITASDNIKLSDDKNGVKVDSIQLSNTYKNVYLFPQSNGEYCIAVDKYKITNILFSSSTKHVAIDIQKLFDNFSAIEHIGPVDGFGSTIINAILDFDLINEYPPKFKTLQLSGKQVTGDISKFSNLINLTTLYLSGCSVTGDISKFSNLINLTTLVLDGNNVTGSINLFNALTNLTSLSLALTQVTGDIINLGSLVNLTNIGIGGSNISGTIESFVQAQRSAGRSSAQITGSSANWGKVTFNGSSTKGALSWTSTTITMNGVTINA